MIIGPSRGRADVVRSVNLVSCAAGRCRNGMAHILGNTLDVFSFRLLVTVPQRAGLSGQLGKLEVVETFCATPILPDCWVS